MKRTVFLLVVLGIAATGSLVTCTIVLRDDPSATILFYNVENLFDAHDDGTEYPEYRLDGGWTEADYRDRLSRLGAALSSARPRPDILILAEIENRHVLEDLLADYLPDLSLEYYAFVGADGGATGIGVASRYPVLALRSLLALAGSDPPLRPAVELRVDLAGEELVIIANHWKSKLGGAAATEPLRRAQAAIVASRCASLHEAGESVPLLVIGDFNEEPHELTRNEGAYITALLPADWVASVAIGAEDEAAREVIPGVPTDAPAAEELSLLMDRRGTPGLVLAPDGASARTVAAALSSTAAMSSAAASSGTGDVQRSPWCILVDPWTSIDEAGSYYYRDHWERIDGIYYSPSLADGAGLEVVRFAPMRLEGAVDEEGIPRSWSSSGGGVSDHLPVMVEISSRPAAP